MTEDLSRTAELAFYGAIEAENLSQLADNTDVLLWWLTNDDAVRDVYLRRDTVLDAMQAGKAVLEMSTSPRKLPAT